MYHVDKSFNTTLLKDNTQVENLTLAYGRMSVNGVTGAGNDLGTVASPDRAEYNVVNAAIGITVDETIGTYTIQQAGRYAPVAYHSAENRNDDIVALLFVNGVQAERIDGQATGTNPSTFYFDFPVLDLAVGDTVDLRYAGATSADDIGDQNRTIVEYFELAQLTTTTVVNEDSLPSAPQIDWNEGDVAYWNSTTNRLEGIQIEPANDRVFLAASVLNPATAGNATVAEVKAYTDANLITDTIVYLTGNDTETDLSIQAFHVDKSGNVTEVKENNTDAIAEIANAYTTGLQQKLLAEDGQIGLTVQTVPYTTRGNIQITSLGDDNVVFVYASGEDYRNGVVKYSFTGDNALKEFEVRKIIDVYAGAILTSTKGITGVCELQSGNSETTLPLLSSAFSFTKTFFFNFRSAANFGTTVGVDQTGQVFVANGAIQNIIKLTFGDGTVVQGQENIVLQPYESTILGVDGNVEYILEGTQPMSAATVVDNSLLDGRVIMPLADELLTWSQNCDVSALYPNTAVNVFRSDGVSSSGTATPNARYDVHAAMGGYVDYLSSGATLIQGAQISAYSGADSSGGDATASVPTQFLSTKVGLPFIIDDGGDGGNSGISISSKSEGTAYVYQYDQATGDKVLAYTCPLTRKTTLTTPDDQLFPCGCTISNNGDVILAGDFLGGGVIADVPILVIAQNTTQTYTAVQIPDQDGVLRNQIQCDDDETTLFGITPELTRPEFTTDANGYLRRRSVDGSGNQTWILN